jgi:hypothetical protein
MADSPPQPWRTPSLQAALSPDDGRVELTWEPRAGATAYQVLRAPLTAGAETESVPVAAGGATGEITGTVMVVNTEKRMLTIKKPDGHFQVIHVPPEAERLDEIKINDKLTITYLEAVAVDLEKNPAGAPGVVSSKEIDRGSGDKPSGSIVETVTLLGVVESVDKAASSVSVRGPEHLVTVTVEDPDLLREIAVGDSVRVSYINAVAAEITSH